MNAIFTIELGFKSSLEETIFNFNLDSVIYCLHNRWFQLKSGFIKECPNQIDLFSYFTKVFSVGNIS